MDILTVNQEQQTKLPGFSPSSENDELTSHNVSPPKPVLHIQELYDHLPVPVGVLSDRDGRLLHANHAAATLFGYSSVANMLQHFQLSNHIYQSKPDFFAFLQNNHSNVLTFSRKNKSMFDGKIIAKQGETGGVRWWQCAWEAVQEQRMAEREFLYEQATIAAFLEAMPLGVYVVGANGLPFYTNQTATAMFSPLAVDDPSSDHGESFAIYRISTQQIYPYEETPVIQALQGKHVIDNDLEVRKGNVAIPLQVWAAPVFDKQGNVQFGISVFQDRSEHLKNQAEIERLHREMLNVTRAAGRADVAIGVLHNTGNALNSLNISVQQCHAILSELKFSQLQKIAKILDENTATLQSCFGDEHKMLKISPYLQLLTTQLQAVQGKFAQEIDAMVIQLQHLRAIIQRNQTFTFAKMIREEFSTREIIQDATVMVESSLNKHNITLDTKDIQGYLLHTDRQKVMEILINLLNNAKESLQESNIFPKLIRIGTKQEGKFIQIQVQDNGPGIDTDTLSQLFQVGFSTKSYGHGYGLHCCANMAQELGGKLECTNTTPGFGATFTLSLPVEQTVLG